MMRAGAKQERNLMKVMYSSWNLMKKLDLLLSSSANSSLTFSKEQAPPFISLFFSPISSLIILMGSTCAQTSGINTMSLSFLCIPRQRMRSSAKYTFSLQRTCSYESGSILLQHFHIVFGKRTRVMICFAEKVLGTILFLASFSSISLKYSRSSSSFWPTGLRAAMLQAENEPGRTWMNLKMDSKGFSTRCSKCFSICCARWMSNMLTKMLLRQSISSLLVISSSSTFSQMRRMYPQTLPTLALSFMQRYILKMASGQGLTPTSSRMVYLGLNSWQKPLKNQLWEESLPAFLYLTQKNRLTYLMVFLISLFSLSPSETRLRSMSSSSYMRSVSNCPSSMELRSMVCLVSWSLRSEQRELVRRRQAEMQARESRVVRYWLHSSSLLASSFMMDCSLMSTFLSLLILRRRSFCLSIMRLRIILRLSLSLSCSFLMFWMDLRMRTTSSYLARTCWNLLSMRLANSSGLKRNLVKLSGSSFSISWWYWQFSYFFLSVSASSSSRKVSLSRSNSSKYSQMLRSTLCTPSIITTTKMSSGHTPERMSSSTFCATPTSVFLSAFLSSLHMLTQMPTSMPPSRRWLIRTSSTTTPPASPPSFFSSEMQLSMWLARSCSQEDSSAGTAWKPVSSYLLSLMPFSFSTSISPAGRASGGSALSVLLVRRAASMGFMKATLRRSSVLTWDMKWRIISLFWLSLIISGDQSLPRSSAACAGEPTFINSIEIISTRTTHYIHPPPPSPTHTHTLPTHAQQGDQYSSHNNIVCCQGMSLLLKEWPSPQDLDPVALRLRLTSILDGLSEKTELQRENEREVAYSLFFRHAKKQEIRLEVRWTFLLQEELQVLVELPDSPNHPQPAPSVPQELLVRLNRETNSGCYYVCPQLPHLLRFKACLPLRTARKHLVAALAEIYRQTESHFLHFAMRCGLLGEFCEPPCDETHKSLILLGRLREHFELQRQRRPKATSYYDLSNCAVRVVTEARALIGCNFALLKKYRLSEGRVDRRRREECSSAYQLALRRYLRHHPLAKEGPIVRGVEVRRVVGERKIDESRFNALFRGVYAVATSCTVNPHLFPSELEQETECELVRKEALLGVSADLSLANEVDFLKFMRGKSSRRIAEYFLALDERQGLAGNCIYSRFYPACLATVFPQWGEVLLLRAGLQVAQGVAFLQEQGVLHRDLKEWNILVDGRGGMRLIDFGSSSGVAGGREGHFPPKETLSSTQHYYWPYPSGDKALSRLFTRSEYNQSSTFDLYSFGYILHNLFGLSNCPDSLLFRELDYLSRKCLEVNPEDRPRPQEVLVYLYETLLLYFSSNGVLCEGALRERVGGEWGGRE